MKLRTIIFWPHLITGVAAALVVFMMSVTGVVLTYEMQMNQWALRHYRANPSPGDQPLAIPELMAKVSEAKPDFEPSSLRFLSDPAEPVLMSKGRRERIYVDRYSGEVLGDGSTKMRSFMSTMMTWHRWFALTGENRSIGRAITGACNLGFLFLVVSGFYLWFPRNWSNRALRNVTWFRTGLRSKARDFNWHNVIGFWTAIPLFIVVLTAVVISYSWAGDLIYVFAGESPPQRSRSHARPQRAVTGERPRVVPASAIQGNGPSVATADVNKKPPAPLPLNLEALDRLVESASKDTPDWNILTLSVPESGVQPVSITVDSGTGRQVQKRVTLKYDPNSGEVLERDLFSDRSRTRQWRSWTRFAHTGEHYGLLGQTIAGIASLGACFLVWTGVTLSWRRFF